MATNKKRINITLEPEMEEAIFILAKKDKVPEATKVTQILGKALNDLEDEILLEIAEERSSEDETRISHDEFWNKVFKNRKLKN